MSGHVECSIACKVRKVKVKAKANSHASMQFGNPPKWQLAIQLAAALGYIALCGGDVLFPIALPQSDYRPLPLRGKSMFSRLLLWIKGLQPKWEGVG